MNKGETTMLLSYMRGCYPGSYLTKMDSTSAAAMVEAWCVHFKDDDSQSVRDAFDAFVATDEKGFPPSIGQIKSKLRNIQSACFGQAMTPVEAWSMVSKAMKNSAYHALEEYNKLPEPIRSVIGGPSQLHDWAVCEDGVSQSVIASQFQKAYAARVEERKELRSYPVDIQRRIESDRRLALGEDAAPLGLTASSAPDPEYDRHLTPEEWRARCKACEVVFD